VGSVFDSKHVATAIADITGDGRPDLLLTRKKGSGFEFRVAAALAVGGFGTSTTFYAIPNNGTSTEPVTLHAIDLNADGFQDVIYPTTAGWKGRLSNGTGLGAEITVGSGCCDLGNPVLVQVMDFDGDGLSDLVTHRFGSGPTKQIVLLRNPFSPASPSTVGFEPAVVLGVSLSSNLFPEQSAGGWYKDVEAPHFDNQSAITAAFARPFDYNGDGAVDLLVRLRQRYIQCTPSCGGNPEAPAGGTTELTEFVIDDAATGAEPPAQGTDTAWASFYLVLVSDGANGFVESAVVAVGDDCTVYDACNPFADRPQARRALPVDINADGLADFAYLDELYDWSFRLNTGAGFRAQSGPIVGFSNEDQSRQAVFIDLTGDGLPDFIYPSAIGSSSATWLLHENVFGAAFTAVQNTQDKFGNSAQFDRSLLVDFTGDGMLDSLFIDLNAQGSIQSGTTQLFAGANVAGGPPTSAVNVVSSITDGFAATAAITYKPLTDASVYSRMRDAKSANWGGFAVYDLVAPIYVVSQAQNSAPVYGSSTAASRVEYHYVGAKLQGGGRGFLGFGEVISWDPQSGIRTNTRYRQDFPFIGLPADTTQAKTSSSQKFGRISNTSASAPVNWGSVTATTAAALPSGTRLTYAINEWQAIETIAGEGTWFPYIADSLERSYTLTGAFGRKVLTSNTYSNVYGNLDSVILRTYATDGSTAFATQTTANTYADNVAKWHLGRLVTSAVTHARSGKPSITRTSSFGYDSASGILNRETAEPGSTVFGVTTDYTLDDFGNRTSATVSGSDFTTRSSSSSYDTLGRFVVETRNAYNQLTQRIVSWDAFGNALQVDNIDAVRTTTAVDYMGRPFVSYTETGASSKTLHSTGAGSYCGTGDTAFYTLTTGGGQPSRYRCFDRLGREVRTATQGFNGSLIQVDRYYDESGRPERVSEPYFAGAAVYWNHTTYDALGRIDSVLAADGNDLTYDYDSAASLCSQAGAARQVRTTNGLEQQQLEVQNALGEPIAVIDNACGVVDYDYDAVGNLTLLTGVDNAQTAMTYDLAGRKTSLSDPDKGSWQYAYNALGELTRQRDSKSQALDFVYDLEGRVTTRYERTGVGSLTDNTHTTVNSETTSWINSTSASAMGKAQPASITYRVGTAGAIVQQQSFSYDAFGRPGIVSTSMDGLQLAEETTYDAYSRVFQHFDVSGDDHGIRYHYDARGYVEKLREAREGTQGVVYQHIQGHDARGNVIYTLLGNGVEVFAEYDAQTGRLKTLDAYDATGVEIQRVDYQFDVLGNLLSRHDTSQSQNLDETFRYDLLNRLEAVFLSGVGGQPQQTLGLTYDAAGNITSKSDVGNYLYGAGTAGPHAVTSTGGITYSYDANGNQVSSSAGRSISYTVFDQAARIQKGTEFTEFAYGIHHQRIKRVDDNAIDDAKTTWYFGSVERIRQNGQNAFFKRYLGGVAIADYFPATGNQSVL
jgi:YD repeat-containing protein